MLFLLSTAFPCTLEVLRDDLTRADSAIAELDPSRLKATTQQLRETLDCLGKPLTVQDAADVHRVLGIAAFVGGDEATTDLWFAAARALEPSGSLGHTIGGPIQAAWDRAGTPIPPDRTDLAAPRRGTLFIDGQPLQSHPAHLPWVFQHVDGATVRTAIVQPDGSPPRYPGDRPETTTTRRGMPLTITAVTAIGLGAACLGGALWTRSEYRRIQVHDPGLVVANRSLGVAGYALGATGLGLGVAAGIRGEW